MKKRIICFMTVALICFSLFSCFGLSSDNNGKKTALEVENKGTLADGDNTVPGTAADNASVDPIVGDTSNKDLKVGTAGRIGDVYAGLQYLKKMSYLPTNLGSEEVSGGNEVILGFFEFYNGSDAPVSVDPDGISCYADGKQVSDVDTYIKVSVDGVGQYYNESLDGGCRMISVQDYEVPNGWTELKFFYMSECIWTVKPEDVSEGDYQRTTLFDGADPEREETPTGERVFSGDYEVTFEGLTIHREETLFSNTAYAVFKFSITNNDNAPLDTSLMGYEMRAYQDNVFLGDASYILNGTVDGFINIFNVDSIEAGMSADVYVAFEISGDTGNFYMAYDDGYITNHLCGFVCAVID